MSVGRFASAIVAGMVAGGLTAMSGVGRDHAEVPVVTPVAAVTTVVSTGATPYAVLALPKLTIVDPR